MCSPQCTRRWGRRLIDIGGGVSRGGKAENTHRVAEYREMKEGAMTEASPTRRCHEVPRRSNSWYHGVLGSGDGGRGRGDPRPLFGRLQLVQWGGVRGPGGARRLYVEFAVDNMQKLRLLQTKHDRCAGGKGG